MPDTSTGTLINQISTVIVPVSDQDAAVAFYTEKLGFEKRADVPMGEQMRWIEVAPPGASSTVAIVPPREGEPVGVQTRIAFSTHDIESAHAELTAAGVDCDEVERMGGPVPPMLFFRDQDANKLLIVELSE
ncbi:MAG TPA: VOC family protein [Solirubrobacteraceae bacterium]|jgi:catechol 2,3-dioxygenase-like lactoylglutathione lyase family enzyme|nr:VOC family protein [Solirubrobacteraceae bacterium]